MSGWTGKEGGKAGGWRSTHNTKSLSLQDYGVIGFRRYLVKYQREGHPEQQHEDTLHPQLAGQRQAAKAGCCGCLQAYSAGRAEAEGQSTYMPWGMA